MTRRHVVGRAPGATAVLVADGTNWHFVFGQQDTGWVNLTLPGGCASVYATPQARLRGDRVELRGGIQNTSAGTITTIATLPAFAAPSAQRIFSGGPTYTGSGGSWERAPYLAVAAASTSITMAGAANVTDESGEMFNGYYQLLDDCGFSL